MNTQQEKNVSISSKDLSIKLLFQHEELVPESFLRVNGCRSIHEIDQFWLQSSPFASSGIRIEFAKTVVFISKETRCGSTIIWRCNVFLVLDEVA